MARYRRFYFTLSGDGTGWAVPTDCALMNALVRGGLLGVEFRLVSGSGLTVDAFCVDGVHTAADLTADPPPDERLCFGLSGSAPTAHATDGWASERFSLPEPFSGGLTPAINVTAGSGAWSAVGCALVYVEAG